jgi:maleate isomerase
LWLGRVPSAIFARTSHLVEASVPSVNSYRVGLIVPSSNVTMETEIPALLRAYQSTSGARPKFTFHGARMRMKKVTAESLLAMDKEGATCAAYLADAQMNVLAYACLVAVMVQGARAHEAVGERLHAATIEAGFPAPIVTSAGALVDEIKEAGYSRISLIAPYLPELTQIVVKYIEESAGVEVIDAISLSVADNCEVGRLSQPNLVEIASKRLNVRGADAVVLSSCVQMPSLDALKLAEDRIGLPCMSAASCTTRQILKSLSLDPAIEGFGSFVASGAIGAATRVRTPFELSVAPAAAPRQELAQ